MAMLGRGAVLRATESLCRRHHLSRMADVPRHHMVPLQLTHRRVHTTPSLRGLLSYIVGDHHHARLHKAIGNMLEDYDITLDKYYKNAIEAVRSS
jgi:hypothetical protein